MKYFSGSGQALGVVSALPQDTFERLCHEVIEKPVQLNLTRFEFHELPEKDRKANQDQNRVKRVAFITPAAFQTSPSQRDFEHAQRCNIIALDIDDAGESQRLLTQRWDDCLGGLAFIVWHTARSTLEAPRLRVIVAADGISVARYPAAARTIGEMLGLKDVSNAVVFHAVQPMFLPTIFAHETQSPVVASNPTGEAFTSGEIIDDGEAIYAEAPRPGSPDSVADLEYLRTPLEGVTLTDAAEALATLDPDMGMQQWIEAAAALKHQFDSPEAYKLWDEWSAKGKKYVDQEETRYRWKSLKAQPTDRAPVTIRSLFKSASARGWSNPALAKRQHNEALAWLRSPQRSTEELLDQGARRIARIGPTIGQFERKILMVAFRDSLVARDVPLPLPDIRRAVKQLELDAVKTTGIPPWAKGLCYVTSTNQFYRATTDRRFSPEVLDLMYSTPQIGDDKPLLPRHYMTQVVGCQQVEALRYNPAVGNKLFFSEGGVPYVNSYRPTFSAPEPDRSDEAGDIYLDHVAKLIAKESHWRTITDFIAYMVKHPGKKIRWAPLIQSGEGAGKTALHAIAVAVLGRRNAFKVSGPDLMSGMFTEWAEGHQLVTIEEIRVVGANRHAVMDKLKTPITDDDVPVHRKREDRRTVPNVTNYMMFTNYHDALALREDGRRYFVLSSPLQTPRDIERIGGKKHYDRLFAMIRDNPGGLRAWFEGWQINPAFDPEGRAPVTEYLYELAENSASPLATAVKNAIEDLPHPLVRGDLLSLSCLRGCLDGRHLTEFSDQALASVLRESGWVKFGRVQVDGSRHQLWTKGNITHPQQAAEARMNFI